MTESTIQRPGANGARETTHEATREPERYSTPPVDIYETAEGLTVIADLPGVPKENIDINVDNDLLTIRGDVAACACDDACSREFQKASYWRQFRLGEKIDRKRIAASVSGGVLKLVLPFEEKTKPRRVEVQVA